jgi:hypothetical protein
MRGAKLKRDERQTKEGRGGRNEGFEDMLKHLDGDGV